MSMETDALLRTILFQVKTAKSLKAVEIAIEAMCTKDVIAAIKEKAEEYKQNQSKE